MKNKSKKVKNKIIIKTADKNKAEDTIAVSNFALQHFNEIKDTCCDLVTDMQEKMFKTHGFFEWQETTNDGVTTYLEEIDKRLWPAIEILTGRSSTETRAYLECIFKENTDIETLQLLKALHEKFGKTIRQLYKDKLPQITALQNYELVSTLKTDTPNTENKATSKNETGTKENKNAIKTPCKPKGAVKSAEQSDGASQINQKILDEICIKLKAELEKSENNKKYLHGIFSWTKVGKNTVEIGVEGIDETLWPAMLTVTNWSSKDTHTYLNAIFKDTEIIENLLRLKFLHEQFDKVVTELYRERLTEIKEMNLNN